MIDLYCWQCYVNSRGDDTVPAEFIFDGRSFCLVHFDAHYQSIGYEPNPHPTPQPPTYLNPPDGTWEVGRYPPMTVN